MSLATTEPLTLEEVRAALKQQKNPQLLDWDAKFGGYDIPECLIYIFNKVWKTTNWTRGVMLPLWKRNDDEYDDK